MKNNLNNETKTILIILLNFAIFFYVTQNIKVILFWEIKLKLVIDFL
jgi:hypothetical protein